MARGNIIQGQASGKLGDTVLMVRNGKQLARVYTTSGARSGESASESARIQRVKFGSASNQWQLYKYVSTRMYRKGRKSNQSDYNYFVKRNSIFLPYLTKQENADGVHVMMPGQFSEGNLGRIELLHSVYQGSTDTRASMIISDANSTMSPNVAYSATMATLKASLAARYPSASKVTYLVSIPQEVTLTEAEETFISQYITHYAIVVDLYDEITAGEDELTVAAYFASKVQNQTLKTLFAAQTTLAISSLNRVFALESQSEAGDAFVTSLAVLVFATNDKASDCYTTMLQDNAIPTAVGPYSVWAGYRTTSALRTAAESYGYQSGVMRDDIASAGDDMQLLSAQYIARLRKVDASLAEMAERQVSELGTTARVVRKQAQPKDE